MKLRLSLGYIKYFKFLGCIKIALWVNRLNSGAGDWFANRFGITSAYQRGHQAVRQPGNVD
jgi:hypothetical protein